MFSPLSSAARLASVAILVLLLLLELYRCWCGTEDEEYDSWGMVDASYCNYGCTGDYSATCGGRDSMQVFQFTQATPAPVDPADPVPAPVESPVPAPVESPVPDPVSPVSPDGLLVDLVPCLFSSTTVRRNGTVAYSGSRCTAAVAGIHTLFSACLNPCLCQ